MYLLVLHTPSSVGLLHQHYTDRLIEKFEIISKANAHGGLNLF